MISVASSRRDEWVEELGETLLQRARSELAASRVRVEVAVEVEGPRSSKVVVVRRVGWLHWSGVRSDWGLGGPDLDRRLV